MDEHTLLINTTEQLVYQETMRTGVNPFGRKLNDVMPSKYYKDMTDVELKTLWAYIKTIPAKEYGQW